MSIRQSVVAHLDLLSQPSLQLEYESQVPIANVHSELVDGFCSDLYHPKSQQFLDAFSEDELRDLAHLYGLLIESGQVRASSVTELLQHAQWRRVVAFAKDLAATIGFRK
jgi:hypothetical protein